MNISAILHTSEFRGDHESDVEIALPVSRSDTIEDLMLLAYSRVKTRTSDASLSASDKIVLRLIK